MLMGACRSGRRARTRPRCEPGPRRPSSAPSSTSMVVAPCSSRAASQTRRVSGVPSPTATRQAPAARARATASWARPRSASDPGRSQAPQRPGPVQGRGPAASLAVPSSTVTIRPGCVAPATSMGVCSGSAAPPWAADQARCTESTKAASRWAQLGGGQRAAEEVEGELPGRQGPVRTPAEVFPPRQRRPGGVLDAGDLPVPFGLIDGERRVDAVRVRTDPFGPVQRRHQRDGVLHGHLGTRADGEVRGVRGVAEQGDRGPAGPVPPALGAPGAEVAPAGVVHQQRAAVDLGREELFQVGLGNLVAGAGRLGLTSNASRPASRQDCSSVSTMNVEMPFPIG